MSVDVMTSLHAAVALSCADGRVTRDKGVDGIARVQRLVKTRGARCKKLIAALQRGS
jgi:hypothetical protein